MKKSLSFIVVAVATLAAFFTTLSSCKKEYIDADKNICFESDVLPIFQSNCTQSGCHNSTDRKGGYDLTTYAGITAKGVVAGNYKNSKMYSVLIENGDDAMPKAPYKRLSDNQIATIAFWIQQGAKNTTNCAVNTCDTTVAKFSTQVKPIMDTYCVGCHADYGDYTMVKDLADAGSLLGTIRHESGFSAMPKNQNKLSDCKISLIEKWVREGKQNN